MKRIFLSVIIFAAVILPSCITITNNYYGDKLGNSIIEFGTKAEETKKADAEPDESETSVSEAETDGQTAPTVPTETGEADTEATQAPTSTLKILSLTSPISVNQTATIKVCGKPNTEYDINVVYSSSASSAKGLENKTSDENGIVSWSWRIGPSVKAGNYNITVKGGGETVEVKIQVD